jgi:hypothetical protein
VRGFFLRASGSVASSEYFGVMGIPIHHGRSFAPGDLRGEAGVVLSQSVARALFGDANAIGRRIRRVDNPGHGQRCSTLLAWPVTCPVRGSKMVPLR